MEFTIEQFKEELKKAKEALQREDIKKTYREAAKNFEAMIDDLLSQAKVKKGDVDSRAVIRISELKYGQGALQNDELAGKFYIPQIKKPLEEAVNLGKNVKFMPVKFVKAALVGGKLDKDFRRTYYGNAVNGLRKFFPKEAYWILGIWPADQKGLAMFGITDDYRYIFKITGAKNVNDKGEGQREELRKLYEELNQKDIEFQQNIVKLGTKAYKSYAGVNTKVISFEVEEERPTYNDLDDIVFNVVDAYVKYLEAEQLNALKYLEQAGDKVSDETEDVTTSVEVPEARGF
ncbi:MAG: hypothetical protein D6780_05030 [Candidatus Dadabacteria bacterium]|nr:MAG: hypothetical protein D6780_05030 [Candidatus Dadabacteria bacterium]